MTTECQLNLFGFDDDQDPSPGLVIIIPESLRPYLCIGTCSWKYDSRKGLLKTYRPSDYLADYARHLDIVEIDQWFWSLFPTGVTLPSVEVVKLYADSVPDDCGSRSKHRMPSR